MKKLVLATLLCGGVAQLGTGCIIVSDDDPDPPRAQPDASVPVPDAYIPPAPGEFLVTWTLVSDDPNTPVGCPPGATTIQIITDPDPGVDGDEFIDLYDCIDGQGLVADLDAGVYDVWIELLDENDNLIAQSDLYTEQALDLGEQIQLDFTFSVDHGYFGLTWTILDFGEPSDCASVGADEVSVLSTLADESGTGFDDIFDCVDGEGITAPLPIGPYVVVVSLIDQPDDFVLGESMPRNVALEFGNDFVDLGNFTFDVE